MKDLKEEYFSIQYVDRLVAASNLEGFSDQNAASARLSKLARLNILRSSTSIDARSVSAAVEIQRWWRGYRVRAMIFNIMFPSVEKDLQEPSGYSVQEKPMLLLKPKLYFGSSKSSLNTQNKESKIAIDSNGFMTLSHISLSYLRSRNTDASKVAIKNQSTFASEVELDLKEKENITAKSSSLSKYDSDASIDDALIAFQGYCAYVIQQWWRKNVEVQQRKLLSVMKKKLLTTVEAATKIQKAWRRHIDLQIFRHYKQLISFRYKGDPQCMLQCINPKETELLDVAAGVHVRFRLGGLKFPPNMYYKIFTHINVADIGSFAPRNYTSGAAKRGPGKFVHTNTELNTETEDDVDEWYQRCENNGWRLVNPRVLKNLNSTSTSAETHEKKINYNHDRLVRKQDIEVRKKRRKINWMKKMYAAGMLQTNRSKDTKVNGLVEAAADSIFTTVEQSGSECIEDWEVNELLQWTNGLNFDSYLQEWQERGTTTIYNNIHDMHSDG